MALQSTPPARPTSTQFLTSAGALPSLSTLGASSSGRSSSSATTGTDPLVETQPCHFPQATTSIVVAGHGGPDPRSPIGDRYSDLIRQTLHTSPLASPSTSLVLADRRQQVVTDHILTTTTASPDLSAVLTSFRTTFFPGGQIDFGALCQGISMHPTFRAINFPPTLLQPNIARLLLTETAHGGGDDTHSETSSPTPSVCDETAVTLELAEERMAVTPTRPSERPTFASPRNRITKQASMEVFPTAAPAPAPRRPDADSPTASVYVSPSHAPTLTPCASTATLALPFSRPESRSGDAFGESVVPTPRAPSRMGRSIKQFTEPLAGTLETPPHRPQDGTALNAVDVATTVEPLPEMVRMRIQVREVTHLLNVPKTTDLHQIMQDLEKEGLSLTTARHPNYRGDLPTHMSLENINDTFGIALGHHWYNQIQWS